MLLQVAVIGLDNTGKTFFCKKLKSNGEPISHEYEPTTGATKYEIRKKMAGLAECDIEIYDVAGLPQYSHIIPMFVRQAHIVILFFDLNKPESFKTIEHYLLNPSMFPTGKERKPIRLLVGNKQDLQANVSTEEIELLLQQHQDLHYYPVSLKTNQGYPALHQAFYESVKRMISRVSEASSPEQRAHEDMKLDRLIDARSRYQYLWDESKTPIANIRRILDDYARSNSTLSLFFSFHYWRSHTARVHAAVLDIDKAEKEGRAQSQDFINKIVNELDDVEKNELGSLARRLAFIKDKINSSHVGNEVQPPPGCCAEMMGWLLR